MDDGQSSYSRFIKGDEEALREIIDLYRANLIFFIDGIIHNASEAEDIAEDSFLELVIHPKRYNFKVSLKTYLYSIARYKAIDSIRYRARHKDVCIDDVGDIADSYIGHEAEYGIKERNHELYSAILSLNEDYRTTLYLFYFEEMDYESISRVMKKNKKQVDNLLCRAKKALRVALEKEGYNYEEFQR